MRVRFLDWKRHSPDEPVDVKNISYSPDEKYAIVEVYSRELFLAVDVLIKTDNLVTARVRKELWYNIEPELVKFDIDWDCINYGFCKLTMWAMERNEFKTQRIYFDADLYKKMYEEKHGVPYAGNKTFD